MIKKKRPHKREPLSKIISLSLKLGVGGGGLTQRLSEDPGSFDPMALVSSAHATRLTQDSCSGPAHHTRNGRTHSFLFSGPAHHTRNGRTHSFLLGGFIFLLTLDRTYQPEYHPRIYPDIGGTGKCHCQLGINRWSILVC